MKDVLYKGDIKSVDDFNRSDQMKNNQGLYLCPECKKEVILCMGTIKEWYASHKNPSDCYYYSQNYSPSIHKEKDEARHGRVVDMIYNKIKNSKLIKCFNDREVNIGGKFPDLTVVRCAFEIQLSQVPLFRILNKIKHYREHGYRTVYIFGYINYDFLNVFKYCYVINVDRKEIQLKKWKKTNDQWKVEKKKTYSDFEGLFIEEVYKIDDFYRKLEKALN